MLAYIGAQQLVNVANTTKKLGCFSDLAAVTSPSSIEMVTHGCLDLLDKSLQTTCRNLPGKSDSSSSPLDTGAPKSLLLCCSEDMCNDVDIPSNRMDSSNQGRKSIGGQKTEGVEKERNHVERGGAKKEQGKETKRPGGERRRRNRMEVEEEGSRVWWKKRRRRMKKEEEDMREDRRRRRRKKKEEEEEAKRKKSREGEGAYPSQRLVPGDT
ncbi:hypothetical protein LSTR_LSTR015568 [Laodelphax striatellus]|uniref:Uncharacterized protein n=1 Tax=Laodelphax striatellus TaxID=195883 RepID=A0A482XEJ7_LAOST|nr:hypothetical protein LSTR_LSTR015568 [Laodelphax striatellus]